MAAKKKVEISKEEKERWVLGYDVKWIKHEMDKDTHPDYLKVKKEAKKRGVWDKF